jgi:dephospho-CoA kinase
MFVIGITGPTGAGKTTALRVLQSMGGEVFDCDAVYHELLKTDRAMLDEIEAAFPGSVENGVLNRKKLGARLFADPAGLQRLTDLTQPLVAKRVLEEITKSEDTSSVIRLAGDAGCHLPLKGKAMAAPTAENSPACHSERSEAEPKNPYSSVPVPDSRFPGPFRFAVIDAIGLFESGLGEQCDLTAAVIADPEVRVKRLIARDGVTEAYARARIAAQKPADWYAERAELTLENNGAEAEFEDRCRALFSRRLRAAASRPGGASRFSDREASNQTEEGSP